MDESEDLYLSGIASAKAGNRRLAQAFFKRVVGINSRHEGAWLWLSEVLDDLDDIAYCLEAVLAINPNNEKARVALELVQKRGADPRTPHRPREWSPLAELRDMDLPTILAQTPAVPTPAPPEEAAAPRRIPPRLVWRAVFFLSILGVLVLSVYLTVRPPAAAPADIRPASTVDSAAARAQEREAVRAYLYQLDALLGQLRLAHDVRLGQIDVRVSLAYQVELNGRLLGEVRAAREQLQTIVPPSSLAEAHQEYVQGLLMEEDALDNLLRFCENYHTGYATGYSNRATVKIQEAREHLERAKKLCAGPRELAGVPEPTRLPTPTPLVTPTYGPSPTPTPTFFIHRTPTPTSVPTKPIG